MAIGYEAPASFRSTAVRPGPVGLVAEGLSEIWSRRRLIRYMVQADLKKTGANTFLGNLWWVIDPLLQMAVYFVLVSVIFANKQPDHPLFLFAAILPWKWFTSSVQDSIGSVVGQERLIKQIHFPKLVLPLANTVAGVAHFAFGLIPLGVMIALLFPHRATPYLLLLPAVAIVQFVFTLALGVALSALNIFYRDIGNVSRHVLRMLFYLSPGIYAADLILRHLPEGGILSRLYHLNPFVTLFGSYRAVLYDGKPPDWVALAVLLGVSFLVLGLAMYFFKRVEPAFAKVL